MKYYKYRGSEPNFGDELNDYLLPKLLPGFFDGRGDTIFLGIGSILFDSHDAEATKIVFGAGYGGYTPKPVLDKRWIIYSVRGPLTAQSLGLDADKVCADLAVLMNLYRRSDPEKKYSISFMPHFQSLYRGNWRDIAIQANMHFIDPRAPVENILEQIQASELVLSEAMHGAIVADAMRVPWIPLLPNDAAHRFKWHDWASALGVKLVPQKLHPSTLYELGENVRIWGKSLKRLTKPLEVPLKNTARSIFEERAAKSLRQAAASNPNLSSDQSIERCVTRFQEDLRRLQRVYLSQCDANQRHAK